MTFPAKSTSWVLGYAEKAPLTSSTTWRDTRLGGKALWPPEFSYEVEPCPLCGYARVLVLQAFAPHSVHSERVLYIFACNSIVCSSNPNSWLALRVFRKTASAVVESPAATDVSQIVAKDQINWGTDSDDDYADWHSDDDGLDAEAIGQTPH